MIPTPKASDSVPMPTELKLPYSLDAERSVLGAILISPHRKSQLDLVTDDFFLPAHRDIWDAMGECEPEVDSILLCDVLRQSGSLSRLEGGEIYILQLSNHVPIAENIEHYAGLVKEKSNLRRIIGICFEGISRASGSIESTELVDDIRNSLTRLGVSTSGEPELIGDVLEEAERVIEERAKEPSKYVIKLGLRDVDKVIGGVRGGQVIVVAGNPTMGKTSLAYGMAISAATEQVPTLMFSLEMKKQELAERSLIRESRNGNLLRDMDYEKWKSLKAAGRRIRPQRLWIDDKKFSFAKIVAAAHAWRAKHAPKNKEGKHGPAMMVVDYLGLVRASQRSDNRQLEMAQMSRDFKLLAQELDLALFLVCQLNRTNTYNGGREPIMSDIKDSGAIEADADIIMFPWRDEFGGAKVIIPKHRNGDTGEIPLLWRGELMSFFDLDDEPGQLGFLEDES